MKLGFQIVLFALLVTALSGVGIAQQVSDTLVVSFPESESVTLTVPKGYTVQTRPGIDSSIIFAPYQEYFLVNTAVFPLSGPTTDVESMEKQMAEFEAKNPDLGYSEQKVWQDPKGPRASFEGHSTVGKKKIVTSNLAYPMGSNLVVFTLMGDQTSLKDQQVIQRRFLDQINTP